MKISLARELIEAQIERIESSLKELEENNTPADDAGLWYLCGELDGLNTTKANLELVAAAFQKGELEP